MERKKEKKNIPYKVKVNGISIKDVKKIGFSYPNHEGECNPTLVLKGVSMRIVDDNIVDLLTRLRVSGLVSPRAILLGVQQIVGNILDDDGRSDILLTFDKDTKIDSLVKIQEYPFVMWTEDFISEYTQDYDLEFESEHEEFVKIVKQED